MEFVLIIVGQFVAHILRINAGPLAAGLSDATGWGAEV
jgi:hypothetical protein